MNLATDELARTSREVFAPDGAAADKVRATLVGLGLQIPVAVATVAEAVGDLRDGDDDGAVLTALAVWDDLMAGRSLVTELVALLDKHLDELRAAQAIAASSPADLPEDLAAQHTELRDLLEAGDLVGKLGRITAITSAISVHRAKRLADLRSELRDAWRPSELTCSLTTKESTPTSWLRLSVAWTSSHQTTPRQSDPMCWRLASRPSSRPRQRSRTPWTW